MTKNNWTATGTGNWTISADWSLGTPTSSQDAFIGTGPSGTVQVSADETVNSIGVADQYTVAISNSILTATVGTGTQAIGATGIVAINNAATFVMGGNLNNAGTIELNAGGNATSLFAVEENANVTLGGGGNFEMNSGNGANSFNLLSGSIFTNFNNDISGTGTISGGAFKNGGIIETNNGSGAGTLDIVGDAGSSGSFTNERSGLMRIGIGGTMVLGSTSTSTSQITNSGTIELLSSYPVQATVKIAGNLTIDNTGGIIQMDEGFINTVESNGNAASLTLNGGTVNGAGYIGGLAGDPNLTVNVGSGATVIAETGAIDFNTSSNTISNHGVLESDFSTFEIDSPLINDGTIKVTRGGIFFLKGNVASSTGSIFIGTGTPSLYGPGAPPGPPSKLLVEATLTGNVTFIDTGGSLNISSHGQVTGDIVGARPGDTIDYINQVYAQGDQCNWQQDGSSGELTLLTSDDQVLQTLTLVGQYALADFAAVSDGDSFTQIELVATPLTVETAGGVDLRWATLYDDLANSPIAAGATATQYTAFDSGNFNGHTAPINFVVSGTDLTYSSSSSNIQLTGGAITGIRVEDNSRNVLATFAGLAIAATTFQLAINSYVAGGTNPNASALNAIFLPLIYNTTGGAGSDKLQGGNSSNTFDASTGNDSIAGGTGINTADYSGLTTPGLFAIIQGGGGTVNKGGADGSDTLTGVGSLTDTGTARSNGDVFEVDAGETVTADSDNFNYLIELTASANLSYGTNFTGISEFVSNTGTNTVDFSLDTSFAYLYGSTGDDMLTLGSGGPTLGSGGGYMFGEGGTNVLTGGQNVANFFVGGSGGTDTMNGGTGSASNYYFVDGNDQVNGAGAFNAMIELVAGVTVQLGSAQYQHVQEFVSNTGTNAVTVANTDSDFTYLYGGASNDTLTTGSGGGYLIGEGGSNVLTGGGGLNVFVADSGAGVDTMNGGSGSNIYYIDANSTVNGSGTFNTMIELQQNVSLTLGSARLGTDVQQVILNGGTNSADFSSATTSVYLYGGSGNDTLFGGTGNDFLYGGTGTNTFKFATGWGQDTIEDWTAGTNSQIDLTGLAGSGVHAITDLTQTITAGNDVITSSHTGTNSITLLGVGTALTAGSFHFA